LNLGITIWGHSLTEILVILAENIAIEEEVKEMGKLLDIYYIPARYPNGFSSGKPADYFTEKQAQEAVNAADHIAKFCESLLFKQG
jgi:HEPN domain-containing protein